MKFFLLFFCLLLLSLAALADTVPDYAADKIAENSYVIHGPAGFPSPENKGFMNNPVFTITAKSVVLIDPGSSLYTGEMVLRQIKKLTNKPITHVLSTHVHGDHWLGNHAIKNTFPNAKFLAHPEMISQANAGAADRWLKIMMDMTKGATKGTIAVIPEKAVNDAARIIVDNYTFEILAPKQAHSGTDIMIHIVEDKVLVSGDNILNQRLGRLDDASFRGSINACDVALASGAKIFVPGHGPTGDAAMVSTFKNYLSIIYNSASELMDEGLSDFEMKPKIVAKLKAFHGWVDFDNQIGKHVSLAVLEAEKASFE
ncbi:MAG: MBL fold metallo-hydrolase [Gammaproteobacteria bacterium]|nr:MBL fold metallo-hydrolase [Gammaproteobacteria bacterium]MDH5729996.1 MBL fold metallo-hydrolase [Gammaproteobacteria bacterium]